MICWCYSCWELLGLLGNESRKYSTILSPFGSTLVRVGVYMLCSSQVMHDIQTYPLIHKIYDCSLLKETRKVSQKNMWGIWTVNLCQHAANGLQILNIPVLYEQHAFAKSQLCPLIFKTAIVMMVTFWLSCKKKKSSSRRYRNSFGYPRTSRFFLCSPDTYMVVSENWQNEEPIQWCINLSVPAFLKLSATWMTLYNISLRIW